MGLLKWLFAIVAVLLAVFTAYIYLDEPPIPDVNEDSWWAGGDPAAVDEAIVPFKVHVEQSKLIQLKEELGKAKFISPLEDAAFNYGFNGDYLRKVVEYWRTKYSWKIWEDKLNSFPQFRTTIGGLNIHFLHVLGKRSDLKHMSLLLIHGWPGSVVEFYKVIPSLQLQAAEKKINLNIVVPSIPGYGFSDRAQKKGLCPTAVAVLFKKLMLRLGYDQFVVQGGDWGSAIGQSLTNLYPNHVIGFHTNMPTINQHPKYIPHQIMVAMFPSLFLSGTELEAYTNSENLLTFLFQEMGYMHIQATKPDTAGVSLLHSPVGLAAYILEKFSTWTDFKNRNLTDGGLTKHFTLDELLTNVMVYWMSDSITSSMRLYKEAVESEDMIAMARFTNKLVPTGILAFGKELRFSPQCLAKLSNRNIIQYTAYLSGGHFAALEKPGIFTNHVVTFLDKIMTLQKI